MYVQYNKAFHAFDLYIQARPQEFLALETPPVLGVAQDKSKKSPVYCRATGNTPYMTTNYNMKLWMCVRFTKK